MYDVVVLSLADGTECGSPRTPVLACADALRAGGATVETVTARSNEEVDEVVGRLPEARLIVASATDGQLRAVIRRMVREYAPAPSRRPLDLRSDRTVPDLPPVGVLPLATGLSSLLGLPETPAEVASAVLADRVRRFDLLRTDAGSVTLDGVLLGASDEKGRVVPWQGRVEVDDTVLSDGSDDLLACAVANASGYSTVDGLPLVVSPDPADGLVEVAVAVPVSGRRPRVEVRRYRGRAVSVTPRDEDVPLLDDGVPELLGRKRAWWVEPGAWAAYG